MDFRKSTRNAVKKFDLQGSKGLSRPELELVETEVTYVENLRILIETFMNPLEIWVQNVLKRADTKKMSPEFCLEIILSEEENITESLFSNIKQILEFNQFFLNEIKSCIDGDGGTKKIALCFERHAPFFRMYSQYITNFDRADKLLTRLSLDPRYVIIIITD